MHEKMGLLIVTLGGSKFPFSAPLNPYLQETHQRSPLQQQKLQLPSLRPEIPVAMCIMASNPR